jgi:Glu-tRNA(Gln) amidotransferase subunit E-like FAD-binding protein
MEGWEGNRTKKNVGNIKREHLYLEMENSELKNALAELLEGSAKGRKLESLFNQVINTRGIHHQLGMNESTVRALRKQFNDAGSISVEKMREVLQLAGYKKVQEERWG